MYSVSDVAPTELILECQQVDVNIICALDLIWQLAPPDLLPLGVVRPSELKGHGDASVHGFIQVMGPAHTLFTFAYMYVLYCKHMEIYFMVLIMVMRLCMASSKSWGLHTHF